MPININIKKKIVINGKEYASPEELPPDLRKVYEQALAQQGKSPQVHFSASSKFTINGQTYNSVDEMPEDARRLYENMMSKFDKNQDGIPDVLQTGQAISSDARQLYQDAMSAFDKEQDNPLDKNQTDQADSLDAIPVEPSAPAISPLGVQNSAIEPDSGNVRLIVFSAIVVLFLLVLGAVVLFQFLR